jgi:hypothetical protein
VPLAAARSWRAGCERPGALGTYELGTREPLRANPHRRSARAARPETTWSRLSIRTAPGGLDRPSSPFGPFLSGHNRYLGTKGAKRQGTFARLVVGAATTGATGADQLGGPTRVCLRRVPARAGVLRRVHRRGSATTHVRRGASSPGTACLAHAPQRAEWGDTRAAASLGDLPVAPRS